jgi:A/G-specific adenine glycosylase
MSEPSLDALLGWYDRARRDLPWRKTRDPYAVWVSEMMLQQTQVATVLGYYERWMKRFPTVKALARAAEDSRARNLWRGARAVVNEHAGRIPRTASALRALPGIGPYSAGAIASIAFGEREPLVDGNVVRVLCRVFGLRGDPSRSPLKTELWELAGRLVPEDRPGDFNQALMELGATVCTPRAPSCDACPLGKGCIARRDGLVERLPELPKRAESVAVPRAAAVVERAGKVLCVRVPDGAARWAGMWQMPNADVASNETAEAAASRAVREATGLSVHSGERLLRVRHSVTHHRITLDVFQCEVRRGTARAVAASAVEWIEPARLDELAMPSAHRRIAQFLVTNAT